MQYVRNLGGSVSRTWNSINPATLSGAIDVIVVEQENGDLACSPFHVRFGKFSLLRPSEKKVSFTVNGAKQEYSMKLGEGGEAFFVFETSDQIPEALQTSPLISPASSPSSITPQSLTPAALPEPSYLDISDELKGAITPTGSPEKVGIPIVHTQHTFDSPAFGAVSTETSSAPDYWAGQPISRPTELDRSTSADALGSQFTNAPLTPDGVAPELRTPSQESFPSINKTPATPPPPKPEDAYRRAMTLSKKLSSSKIRSKVTDSGDLMLDMTGYKSSEDDALRAEAIARNILSEEIEGNYDIGALLGTDENGNLWIYSSEEAKDAARQRSASQSAGVFAIPVNDAASDPGYHSGSEQDSSPNLKAQSHQRSQSEETPSTLSPKRVTSAEFRQNFEAHK